MKRLLREATICGVTFQFSFSTQVMAYYMRIKRIGISGADKNLPAAMETFSVFELAEVYLVSMYLAFKNHERPAILHADTDPVLKDRIIKDVLIPTSMDAPTFGIPKKITVDDVLIAIEEDPTLLSQFGDSRDPGITPSGEGTEDTAGEKK